MSDQPHDLSPSLGGQQFPAEAPRLGGDAALTHLVSTLRDPDPVVRERAVEGLEAIGGERIAAMLVQAAYDEELSVRRRAINALTRFNGEDVHAVMRHAITDDDPAIRQQAATTLGAWQDAADADLLLGVLTQDNIYRIRGQAALALARIGEPRVLPQMIHEITSGYMASVNYREYVQALREFYVKHPQGVADAMVANVLDASQRYYAPILRFFGALKPREALPALIDAARSDAHTAFQRRNAMWALGYIRDALAAPVFIEIACDERVAADVRSQAVRNLGKIKDASVYAPLLELLEAGGPLAEAAWKGLSYLPIQDVLPELIALSRHDDWKTRRRVLNILRARRSVGALPAIIERLSDARQEVRLIAVKALERIRHDDAAPALLHSLIHDRADSIRAAAAHALRFYDYAPAMPALAAALSDPKDTVRFHAALTLGNLYASNRGLFDAGVIEAIRQHATRNDHGYSLRRIFDNR